jgi:putative transcriptional regulator
MDSMSSDNIFCRGQILISNSTIISDEFNKTVVFMVEHDKSGAFGLVINKKSDYSLSEVVVGLPENISQNIPMYWGGPVDHSFISILHNDKSFKDPGLLVIPGVYLSRSYELLVSLLNSENVQFKVFHGYSGWGAGQLEEEFERKSWVLHKVNDRFILDKEEEEAWRDALKSKGGIYKYFADHTKDPLLN